MTSSSQKLYLSSNGDSWLLIHDATTGRRVVRHEPNVASGGRSTDIAVEEFLKRDAFGPEHAALRLIIRTER